MGVRQLSFSATEENVKWYHDEGPAVPDLRSLVSAGCLRHLTSFHVNDFHIDPHVLVALFGPNQSLRGQIADLSLSADITDEYFTCEPVMLFLFVALLLVDPEEYTAVTLHPTNPDSDDAQARDTVTVSLGAFDSY
ncbi:hypothetical protein JCM11641_003879 [Rhodosporidiobolus odoratus]